MTDLDKLIAVVEEGWFALGVLPHEHEVPAYAAFSGSIDAAKRLHDALLPEWAWDIHCENVAEVWERGLLAKSTRVFNDGGNPARAWLLAILNALKDRETKP